MNQEIQTATYRNDHGVSVMAGLLIGGLAGAVAMLLLAPQSGARTRDQIQEKGIELRDEGTDVVDAALAKIWLEKNKLTRNGRRKANELIRRGKILAAEQLERVTETAKIWKNAHLSV